MVMGRLGRNPQPKRMGLLLLGDYSLVLLAGSRVISLECGCALFAWLNKPPRFQKWWGETSAWLLPGLPFKKGATEPDTAPFQRGVGA